MRLNRSSRAIAAVALAVAVLLFAGFRLAGQSKSVYMKLKAFSDMLDKVRTDYIEEKDAGTLVDAAIRGMTEALDPHTTYLTESEFERWNQDYEGYSGIGIYFDILDRKITIVSVIRGGPSDRAGLQVGDRIVAVDGVSAIGMKREEVPHKLMGPRGTLVTVSVERSAWPKSKTVTIAREEVHVESVPVAFLIQPDVGYVGIARFSATTDSELEQALKKLEWLGMKKIVLDLRQNGGGYLEEAARVADKFLPGGKKIVYTKGRTEESFREYFSTERQTHPMLPAIVLIDRASASASEIVAGALQDWDRALIVGEVSFGKGLVQTPYRFTDGSVLLLTTAAYYTPAGRMIQRPYNDKSPDDYFSEIETEGVRTAAESDQARPVFKTLALGRKVTGGGGITPDVFFAWDSDTLSTAAREILFSAKRPLFTFIETKTKHFSQAKSMGEEAFLKRFQFDASTLGEFRRHLESNGIRIPASKFRASEEELRFLLKRTLAEKIWGDEAGLKLQVLRDHRLADAMNHFGEAEALVNAAYPRRK